MYLLYNVLFLLFALAYLPLFILKGKFGEGAGSRFGSVSPGLRETLAGKKVVWVHAVSVGEVALAVSLVNRLRERMPEAKFLFTATTTAGYAVARKIKNEEDALAYFPIDFPWAVRSFLDAVNPSLLVLLETEIWPNLLKQLSARAVPVLIVNGRLSDRAFAQYLRARFFFKGILGKLDGISAQDARMRARFLALGAPEARLSVNGNLKYDWEPSPLQDEAAAPLKRALKQASPFLFIAGSTHEGEEEIFFKLLPGIRREFPQARLLIAPRHRERMNAIERTAERLQVRAARVTTASYAALSSGEAADVWLLDQVGVLASLYECADLVFVGGSLVPVGGHNLAEPAFYAKPVLFGPHMQNFSEMASEFKANRAAVEVADAEILRREWEGALKSPETLRERGHAAQQLVRRHQGAAQKNIEWIMSIVESKERSFAGV